MKNLFTFLCFIIFLNLNAQVLINQIYGGGGNTGATWNKDVIQLINIGSSTVDLSGYAIQYASSTGSSWNVDPIPSATTIAAGAILNILLAGGANGNPPPAPSVQAEAAPGAQINMAATAGKIALTNSSTVVSGTNCPTGANIIDYVGYGSTSNCGPHTTANESGNTEGYWRTDTAIPGSYDPTTSPLSANFPLPISIIDLNIIKYDNKAIISWQTSSETNNSHFIIEWSRDAKNFEEIARIYGKGTTREVHNYNFIHETPVAGTNYYRLTQVDFDGRKETFTVKSVFLASKEKDINIIPTLAKDNMKIEFSQPVINGRLLIYNMDGRMINSYVLAEGIDILRIDVSDLLPGQYIAKYIDGEETICKKFIKQ